MAGLSRIASRTDLRWVHDVKPSIFREGPMGIFDTVLPRNTEPTNRGYLRKRRTLGASHRPQSAVGPWPRALHTTSTVKLCRHATSRSSSPKLTHHPSKRRRRGRRQHHHHLQRRRLPQRLQPLSLVFFYVFVRLTWLKP